MRIFKRLVSLFLCIALIASMFSACSSLNLNTNNSIITKAEWIELLAKNFGLFESEKKTPYFSDVPKDSKVFNYVQACKEWDILPDSQKSLDISSKINRAYALATAKNATDEYAGNDNEQDSITTSAKEAVDRGIGASKSWLYMHEGVDEKEAQKIIDRAKNIAFGSDALQPEYSNINYNENVKVLKDDDKYRIDLDNNTVEINGKSNYKYGDIISFGTGIDTTVLKVKKSKTVGEKTIIQTEEPNLDEVFSNADFAGYAVIDDPSCVKTEPGVTMTSMNGVSLVNKTNNIAVEHLGRSSNVGTENIVEKKEKDNIEGNVHFEVSLGPGGIIKTDKSSSISYGDKGELKAEKEKSRGQTFDTDGNPIDPSEFKKRTGEFFKEPTKSGASDKLVASDTYKKGWTLTGAIDLNINKIYAKGDFLSYVFNPWHNKPVSVNWDITADASIKLEGKLTEELKVGEIIAPIPVTGNIVSVEFDLILYAEVNGSIKVGLRLNNKGKIELKKGAKPKTPIDTTAEPYAEVNLTLETGVKPAISINITKFKVIDFSISFGIKMELLGKVTGLVRVDNKTYKISPDVDFSDSKFKLCGLYCLDFGVKLPIVKFEINKTKSNTITKKIVSLSVSICDEGGLFEPTSTKIGHLEYHAGHLGTVDECSLDGFEPYKEEKEDEPSETTSTESEEDIISGMEGLQIDAYAMDIDLGSQDVLNITSIPQNAKLRDVSVSVKDTQIADAKLEGSKVIITGISEGSTTISISCKESKLDCLVIVAGE